MTVAAFERVVGLKPGSLMRPTFKVLDKLSSYGVDINYIFNRSSEMWLPTKKIKIKIDNHTQGQKILLDETLMSTYYPGYKHRMFKDVVFGNKVMIVSILEEENGVQATSERVTEHAI